MTAGPGRADPVVIVEHDAAWPAWFDRAAAAIRRACAPHVIAVEHIGSTSVPGLAAKPIVDVMPLLARLEDGHACIAPLAALGYESRGEFGIPGRHYFVREADGARPGEHVHMYAEGADEAVRHRLLRDYLRAHPARAAAYAALKHDLAARFRDDRVAYTEAKSEFILETIARARSEGAQRD